MTYHLRTLTLAGLLAATLAGAAGAAGAAPIYSDDFTTDPFSSTWSATNAGGSYPIVWTGNTTPNPSWSGSLPVNVNNHSVYSAPAPGNR